MKRISQIICASARELTSSKRYPSRALVLNETTGELRRGPGTWPEMQPYTENVAHDVEVATVATTPTTAAEMKEGETVNGRALVAGDVVLKIGEADAKDNGFFVSAEETDDVDRDPRFPSYDLFGGLVIQVMHGTKKNALYLCTNGRTGELGTTALNFQEHVNGRFAPAAASVQDTDTFELRAADGTVKTVAASVIKTYITT